MQRIQWKRFFCLFVVAMTIVLPANAFLTTEEAHADTFVHPGILHNATDLARMINNQNIVPWKSALETFETDDKASSSYALQGPYSIVCRKAASVPECSSQNYGNSALENDARAAYYNALLWNVTGNQAHADKAIQILNAWSNTLTSIAGTDAPLASGDNGIFLANAGELLRYSSSGWSSADATKLEDLLVNTFYPHVETVGDANWGGSAMKTLISIAIFTNDQSMFDYTINQFKTNSCASVTRNIIASGQISESGRDQAHALGGLGNLIVVAETAWKQGVDLYSEGDNRLLAGSEYWSNYNLGNQPASYDTTYGRCTMGPWGAISATLAAAPIRCAARAAIFGIRKINFAYVPLTGDRTITARVVSLTNTHSSAKAGVMVRESLSGYASNVYAAIKPSKMIFQSRTAPGAITSAMDTSASGAPYWVRLTRTGNTVTTYHSANGTSWTQTGTAALSASGAAYYGLAVTSHANSILAAAVFDNVSIQ
ncbi:alginate lyase family protein [Paenibacillus sp. HB172176]|uniref:alginate lyase family protein n=1 Tax=Paenibacillus sp. HB172176 TaxID=2493690 RepID=UPI001439D615|nr:alginate lyase family protein [Paenibacillus sp. HB172176]